MTRDEFILLNDFYNAAHGRAGVRTDVELQRVRQSQDTYLALKRKGYLSESIDQITALGEKALEPYKVDNAVILAAGAATRFVPLSLEKPKGLFEVKGETLIERQICQLLDAGIQDITIVLGYKKQMFQYLKEKYPVRFIENPSFHIKNNIESLYLAKDKLKNTYVCSCDNYFVENPFNKYEYHSFYAGYETAYEQNEMYAIVDDTGRITKMIREQPSGDLLMGHSFWTSDFSKVFIKLVEKFRTTGKYDSMFWEWLVRDYLFEFPPMYLKKYLPGQIHEFDYFDQLRAFDTRYVEHSHSEIIRNIKLIFRCDEKDIAHFRRVNEGMTNTSFVFQIDGVDYIYRHPGSGTENIISRVNEKNSLILAKKYQLDPTYIYMDIDEGWKISQYIPQFREPEYDSFSDSQKILTVLRKLHSFPIKTNYGMHPWEDALHMEKLLCQGNANIGEKIAPLKKEIYKLYCETEKDDVQKCFCHGDTYKHNWMIRPDGSVILIDWEYAGYSDPGIDVGYYIVDAMYGTDQAKEFVGEYLQDDKTDAREFHFMAYTAIIAYYWYIWALYRESCGAVIGESLDNWKLMAERFVGYL